MLTRRRLLRLLPPAATGLLMGCQEKELPRRYQLPDKPLQVLTTTIQAADLLQQVGGDAVKVRSLIPAGANPHLWQPSAAEVGLIQISDVFVLSGLGLESNFKQDLDTLRTRGLTVGVLANGLVDPDLLLHPDGKPDPHFWMDPTLWAKAATEAGLILAEAFPPGTAFFSDQAHAYGADLGQLHGYAQRRFQGLPAHARSLLCTHDSMAYFGRVYALETRSLADPAGSAPEILPADLLDWIASHHVRTLFRESIADPKIIRSFARQHSLNSDLQIFSLSLAPAGTRIPGTSSELEVDRYLPALRYTIDTILDRLALE